MPTGFSFEEAMQGAEAPRPFSFIEAFGPEVQWPTVGPQATLPDFLAQPRRDIDLFELDAPTGKMVPSVLPGTSIPWEPTAKLPDDEEMSLPEKYTATALRAGAGFLQRAAPAMEKIVGLVGEIGPVTDPFTQPVTGSLLEQQQTRRYMRTPGQIAKEVSESELIKNADFVRDWWKELIPTTEKEEKYWLAKGAEEATAMIPYFLTGGAGGAPVLIAAETVADHIVNDYENNKQNLGEEEAGRLAINNALTAGALQFAVFRYLPKPLRAAGERFIVQKFGADALSEFIGTRVASTAQTAGLFSASAAAEAVASGRAPSLEELGGGATAGGIFGFFSPYGEVAPRPEIRVPSTPQQRAARVQRVLEQGAKDLGFKWSVKPGGLPGGRVAHTLKDGSVQVDEANFHRQVELERARGVSEEEAIANVISEESNHGMVITTPGGKEIAENHWNNFSAPEKAAFKRLLHGKDYKGKPLSAEDYGYEAIRFAMQRLRGRRPGEHIFGTEKEIFTSKMLTSFMDVIAWIRQHVLRTPARTRQLADLDLLQNRASELLKAKEKGAPSATQERIIQEGRVAEHPGAAALGLPAEAGGGDRPVAAAGLEEKAQVSLGEELKIAQESNESIAARTAVGPERDAAMSQRRKSAVKVASSAKTGDVLVREDGTRVELESLGSKSDAKGEFWARSEGGAAESGGVIDVGVEIQSGGHIESKARPAQIPLKPQAGRGMALIKNVPVVKDVPPGSIHPDSIIPAIRLINGDVIHGWIKKNGKAATHPEIAKRYGITVEELDRKGWISKDGKAFYEREPAAKGTLLPTGKKEGELHSTDKPVEKVAPVAPTKGPQPLQGATGLATVPPADLLTMTAGGPGPAAEAKLGTALEKIKQAGFTERDMASLEELNRTVADPQWKFDAATYKRWTDLSDKLAQAEAKAGVAPSPQGEEGVAMTRKPRAEETAKELGIEYAGTQGGRDYYYYNHPKTREMIIAPEGSETPVIKQKMAAVDETWEGVAMTRKISYTDAKGERKEVDLPPGDRVVTVQRPDGTTYQAGFGDKYYDIPESLQAKYGAPRMPSVAKVTESGKLTHGMLAAGEKIIADEGQGVAMTAKRRRDYDELSKKYPDVKWSSYQSGSGNYLIDPEGRMGKIDTDHDASAAQVLKHELGQAEYDKMRDTWESISGGTSEIFKRGWFRGAQVNTPEGPMLYVSNFAKRLSLKQKAALVNHGIENNITVIEDSSVGTDVKSWRQNVLHDAREMPVAMTMKGRTPEEEVYARIISAVGGVGTNKAKLDQVREVAKIIMKLPREQWDAALTTFQSEWKQIEIEEAQKRIIGEQEGMISEETFRQAQELTGKLSAENIEAVFGPVDRAGAYRSALYVLNKVPQPIAPKPTGPGKTPEEIAAVSAKPVSQAVTPRYNVGDYKEFWDEFHERHPKVPEWVAQEVFNNALDDFLNNASGERLRLLLRPARLERKFLGERAAQRDPKTGELDVSMLRPIPDPDPNPIIADMVNSPSPDQALKFRKFWEARDMTPEQALAELNRLRELENQEAAELARMYPPEKGMAFIGGQWRKVTQAEYEAYLARGGAAPKTKGGAVWQPGTREPEPLTPQERRRLEADRMEGRRILAKRREKVISELRKWYTKGIKAPEKSPMRRTVTLDDIWPGGDYAEYDIVDAGDMSFLKKTLGRGSSKGITGTKTRAITIVVNKVNGDFHAVSTYVRGKEVRIYDPSGMPGSKTEGYITLSQLVSGYEVEPGTETLAGKKRMRPAFRVVGSMEVRDPVYNFHQVWRSEPGKTGQQKFNADLGDAARGFHNSSQEQRNRFIRESEAERRKEFERLRRERFFGKVKEEEVTGEVEGKPETVAEEEAAAAEAEKKGEVTTEREEEPELSVREQIAREREAAGLKPWEEGEEWRGGEGREALMTEAAMQTWYAGKGRGAGMKGMFQTDLRHLAEEPLVRSEAEALYEIHRELRISNPFEWFRLIEEATKIINEGVPVEEQTQAGIADVLRLRRPDRRMNGRDVSALYAFDKIANKIYDSISNLAYYRAKLSKLPPIPEDRLYRDMSPEERQHYDEVEALKYIALRRAFTDIYELTRTSTESGALAEKAAAKGVTVPEDAIRFADRAMDTYGPSARRELELAALSAQRAPEASGARTLLAGAKFGGAPRTAVERIIPGAPRELGPPRMLTGEEQMRLRGRTPATIPKGLPPAVTAFTSPVAAPGEVPVERPMGAYLRETYAATRGGKPAYEPSAPSIRDLLRQARGETEEGVAMTLKGVGVARRYREEMAAQGRTTWQHEDQPPVKKEELIAGGRDLVIGGKINPEKEMRQFEIQEAKGKGSGYLSVNSTLAFRYWDYRLQSYADALAVDPKYGVESKEFKAASEISENWYKRLRQASPKMFAMTGLGLQGWNQIGPNDMKSTTFVRRFLKKSKAKRMGVSEEDSDSIELDEVDEENVQRLVRESEKGEDVTQQLSMLVGEHMSTAQDPPLDPGQQQLVTQFDQIRKQARAAASNILGQRKPPPAMAMKGEKGPLPDLDPEQLDALGNIGFDVMADLSKAGTMTDALWLSEMKKVLASPEVNRPDLEPYLPKVRAISQEIRDAALNNYIGTGDAVKDARFIFTRKRPPLEESIAAIHRALQADPSGENITPAEAYHVWNYIKTRFLDNIDPNTGEKKPIRDFQVIRVKASAELAIRDKLLDVVQTPYPQLRLFRAISSNRTMRKLSSDLIIAMRNEARIKGQAMNWLKNQEYPAWLRTVRLFPRLFFIDKIMGHGFVPMITHAPTLIFNPQAWSAYFGTYRNGKWTPGAWQEMYRMAIGTQPFTRVMSKLGMAEWKGETGRDYHARLTQELTMKDRFEWWKKNGLQIDPFKYTDDYQIQMLQNIVGDRWSAWTGGRGFDALKTLRYAMAEKWFNSLPEHLQNSKSAVLIADSVNHATGIVQKRFHEAANWLMFAPKLEASRWAYLFRDTIKATDYIRNWKTASLEQRAWAVSELKQKASVFAWYAGMLAMNQAFLWMLGSDKKINGIPESLGGGGIDPKKPDFLQFKVAGFRVGLASPFTGMFRMFARAIHAAVGERTKFEKLQSRQEQFAETAWYYGRGKASPFAAFGLGLVTQEDPFRRKLPWSKEAPSRHDILTGKGPYTKPEYFMQTFAPIPVEEAIRETFRSEGMTDSEATRWLRILTIAGGMGFTGARIADEELE